MFFCQFCGRAEKPGQWPSSFHCRICKVLRVSQAKEAQSVMKARPKHDQSQTKPSKAKPRQTKPSRAKQRQVEQSKAKQSQTEQRQAMLNKAKQSQAKPSQAKPSQTKRKQVKQTHMSTHIAFSLTSLCHRLLF